MAEKQPIDWQSIVDDFQKYSSGLLDEVSTRTKSNAGRASDGDYGFDQLVADVEYFWQKWSDGVTFALDTFNKRVVKRDGE